MLQRSRKAITWDDCAGTGTIIEIEPCFYLARIYPRLTLTAGWHTRKFKGKKTDKSRERDYAVKVAKKERATKLVTEAVAAAMTRNCTDSRQLYYNYRYYVR